MSETEHSSQLSQTSNTFCDLTPSQVDNLLDEARSRFAALQTELLCAEHLLENADDFRGRIDATRLATVGELAKMAETVPEVAALWKQEMRMHAAAFTKAPAMDIPPVEQQPAADIEKRLTRLSLKLRELGQLDAYFDRQMQRVRRDRGAVAQCFANLDVVQRELAAKRQQINALLSVQDTEFTGFGAIDEQYTKALDALAIAAQALAAAQNHPALFGESDVSARIERIRAELLAFADLVRIKLLHACAIQPAVSPTASSPATSQSIRSSSSLASIIDAPAKLQMERGRFLTADELAAIMMGTSFERI